MHRAVSLWKGVVLNGVVQRSVCNTTWVAALTGQTYRRGHNRAIHHVYPMKGGVPLCGADQHPQLPSACHFMKRRRPSFTVSQTHSREADRKNWISRQDALRIPTSNSTQAKDFPIPKLIYSYSKSQRVSYPRAVCIPLTLSYLPPPFLLPEDCPDVLECSNGTTEKESTMWYSSVMEYHLPPEVREEDVVQCSSVMKNAKVREEDVVQCSSVMKNAEVTEEDVVQCSSVMKKRRRKMNRHKYKKWRKKMRFLRRSLGK